MRPSLLFVAIVLALTVAAQSNAQGVGQPRNLQVLPTDLSRDSVVKLMRFEVASGLGVTCGFCHGAPGVPFDSIDFASDDKQAKRTAREMMRMLARINNELLPAVPGRGTPPLQVSCITCHRGATRPLMLEDTLGTILARFGPDSAAATYERLGERYAGRFAYDFGLRSLNALAERLIEKRQLVEARWALELNIRVFPQAWSPVFTLAQVLESLGERDLAIAQYRRVLELFPPHVPSRRRLEALTDRAP
jgi:hypothetical protein